MAGEGEDSVVARLNEKLGRLDHPSGRGRFEGCIFKVPNEFLNVDQKAYEPKLVAIGPYHRDKHNLKAMEQHKIRFLQKFLQRGDKESVVSYVKTVRELEDEARRCYAKVDPPMSLNKDEFVEMMVLDGCFIVELILQDVEPTMLEGMRFIDVNDPLFRSPIVVQRLKSDLLLLGNQLPFFVLEFLYYSTPNPVYQIDFVDMVQYFFENIQPGPSNPAIKRSPLLRREHILSVFYSVLLHDYSEEDLIEKKVSSQEQHSIIPIRCAAELQEAGIKFQKGAGSRLLDIKFRDGTLEIPTLSIKEETVSLLQNLVAYELFSGNIERPNHILDYATTLNCLIGSAMDVKLLRECGIFDTNFGDDEVVNLVNVLKRLRECSNIDVIAYHGFYYAKIFDDVNEYCTGRSSS